MHRTNWLIPILCFSGTIVPQARAQQSEADWSHTQAAFRALQATGDGLRALKSCISSIDGSRPRVIDTLQHGFQLSASQSASLTDEIIVPSARANCPDVLLQEARLFASKLSEEELDQVTVFYNSPAGKKLAMNASAIVSVANDAEREVLARAVSRALKRSNE